jgi:hypothetical protein
MCVRVGGEQACGESVVIELPLPHNILHPNGGSRHHHAKVARLVKDARGNANLCALSALGRRAAPAWESARLDAAWYFDVKRLRKHDDDNLTAWLKPYRDGLADAGLVPNDSRFVMGSHRQHKSRLAGVVITVTAMDQQKEQ